MHTPGPLPRDVFAGLVDDLSAAAFVAFVADLYAARGWEVTREGAVLGLQRGPDTADRRTVLVVHDGKAAANAPGPDRRPDREPVDVVVAADPGAGAAALAETLDADLLGPTDLYGLALYGVDRTTSESLFRAYFGRGVAAAGTERPDGPTVEAAAEEPDRERTPTTGRGPSRGGRPSVPTVERPRLVAVVAILAVLVLVGGAFGAPGLASLAGRDHPTNAAGPVGTGSTADAAVTTTAQDTAVPPSTASPSPVAGTGIARAPTGASRPVPVARSRYVDVTPTCERPPDVVLVVLLGALEHNDPSTDDGIRTAWNFSARSSPGSSYRSFVRYLSQPQFDPLFTHRTVSYGVTGHQTDIVSYRVTATRIDGRQNDYTVVLEKRTVGPREGCWLLAGVVPDQ